MTSPRDRHVRLQYGVLPFRRLPQLEVLLLTSRDTRRWVIPKGWPIAGLSAQESAATEALEEAGIIGATVAIPLGFYRYAKRRRDGVDTPCDVQVFPMEVTVQLDDWPEKAERELRWFAIEDAAGAVQEQELAAMIRQFGRGRA